MRRRYRWLGMAVGALALAGAVVLGRARAGGRTDTSAPPSENAEETRAEMRDRALAATLGDISARLASLEQSQARRNPHTSRGAGAAAREIDSTANHPAEHQVTPEGVLGTYDAALAEQKTDPEWDRRFRGAMEVALKSESMRGISVARTHCGSTLCRLELASPDAIGDRNDEVLTTVARAMTPHGGVWMNTAVGGDRKAVIFVSRQGSNLPPLEP
jgi:hypothetical protein